MDFVTVLKADPAWVAEDLLAQALANDPKAAGGLAARLAPAVVNEPILAGPLGKDDVSVLARNRAVDLGLLSEGQ